MGDNAPSAQYTDQHNAYVFCTVCLINIPDKFYVKSSVEME